MGLFALLVELGLDAVAVEVLLVEFRVVLTVVFVDVGGCGGGRGRGIRNWALLRLLEVVDLLFSLGGRSEGSGGSGSEGSSGRYWWNRWDVDIVTRWSILNWSILNLCVLHWSRVELFLRFFGFLNGKLEKGFLAEGVGLEGSGIILVFGD